MTTRSLHCYVCKREDGDIRSLITQVQIFEVLYGRLPTQEEGLKALVNESHLRSDRRFRKLLEAEPIDSWGRKYQYRTPALYSKDGFDLFSLGPDGIVSADDIGNWD